MRGTLLYATMLLGTAQAQGSGQAAASDDEPAQQLQSSTASAAVPVFSMMVLPDQPKVITGQYGTRALIPANAFVFPDGTPVTSPVTVEVREVANKRGMILENLPTISNGRLLESGGVVKVTATSAGRELELADGKSIYVQFPGGNLEGMTLFAGQEGAGGVTNWVPMTSAKPARTEVELAMMSSNAAKSVAEFGKHGLANPYTFIFADKEASVHGLLYKSLESCYDCRGTDAVYLEVIFDEEGKTLQAKTLTGKNECYKKALLELVRFVPWDFNAPSPNGIARPAPRRIYFEVKPVQPLHGAPGENVFVSITERSDIALSEGDRAFLKQQFEVLKAAHFAEEALAVTKLGWINCDRFAGVKEVVAFNVSSSTEQESSYERCFLAFKDINSVLEGSKTRYGNWQFSGVPAGREATVVILGRDPKQGTSIGTMDIVAKSGSIGKVEMQSANEEEIQSILKTI